MIKLHTAATPNVHKVSITREALGLPHTLRVLDLTRGEQKRARVSGDLPQWPHPRHR